LNRLYNTCDVLVMPNREVGSRVEGFGIVFLEANACKKPVIGGRSGSAGDAIVSGETGFLVNPNDASQIEERIVLLLNNPHIAERMGERGFQRIRNGLTWDKIVSGIRLSLESI